MNTARCAHAESLELPVEIAGRLTTVTFAVCVLKKSSSGFAAGMDAQHTRLMRRAKHAHDCPFDPLGEWNLCSGYTR